MARTIGPATQLNAALIPGRRYGIASLPGTFAVTEARDTAAFSGTVIGYRFIASATQLNAALLSGQRYGSFTRVVIHTGNFAATDTPDALAITGIVVNAANRTIGNVTELNAALLSGQRYGAFGPRQTVNASVGNLKAVDPQIEVFILDAQGHKIEVSPGVFLTAMMCADVMAIDATVAGNTSAGSLAATDPVDSAAFSGTVLVQGNLAVTDAKDVFAAEESVTIAGFIDANEAKDAMAFTGTGLIVGDMAASESPDIFSTSQVLAAGVPVRPVTDINNGVPIEVVIAAYQTGNGVVPIRWVSDLDAVPVIVTANNRDNLVPTED